MKNKGIFPNLPPQDGDQKWEIMGIRISPSRSTADEAPHALFWVLD